MMRNHELIVTRRHPTTLAASIEETLDPVAGGIEMRAEADWIARRSFTRGMPRGGFRANATLRARPRPRRFQDEADINQPADLAESVQNDPRRSKR